MPEPPEYLHKHQVPVRFARAEIALHAEKKKNSLIRNLQVKGAGKNTCNGSYTAKKMAAKVALPLCRLNKRSDQLLCQNPPPV